MMKRVFLPVILLLSGVGKAQTPIWPEGKKAVIVLTYDDALASQLDIAIPQLNRANLKGTFFMQMPSSERHVNRWRAASKNGHELGNHTVYHPCLSTAFQADSHYHAENYSVANIIREISAMNKFLYALDNKTTRTYAYPCVETSVGGKSYVDSLKRSGFVKYARGGGGAAVITDFTKLDHFLVPCMGYAPNPPATDLIGFVKQVQQSKGMGVFIFHGVGGDYLEVSAAAHQQLVQYLKDNSKDIWVTTFEKAMDYVTKNTR